MPPTSFPPRRAASCWAARRLPRPAWASCSAASRASCRARRCRWSTSWSTAADVLEVHADAFPAGARVLVHDDLLATGGTARRPVRARRGGRGGGGGLLVPDRAGLPGRAQPAGGAAGREPGRLRLGIGFARARRHAAPGPSLPRRSACGPRWPTPSICRAGGPAWTGSRTRPGTPGPRCSRPARASGCGPTTRCWSPSTRGGGCGGTRSRSRRSSGSCPNRSPSWSWSRSTTARGSR